MNFNIYCVLLAVALGITIPALPKASAEDAGKEDITKRAALRSRILLSEFMIILVRLQECRV